MLYNYGLEKKMKELENKSKLELRKDQPIVIRVDGKAFCKMMKKFDRPYDELIQKTMQETAIYLCKSFVGCKMAFTFSDEISLLLDNSAIQLFNYNVQKIASTAASMATMSFNGFFFKNITEFAASGGDTTLSAKYLMYAHKCLFDGRVSNLPIESVAEYFIWRQQYATKISLETIARLYFDQSDITGKTPQKIKDMISSTGGKKYSDYPSQYRNGTFITKQKVKVGKKKKTRWYFEDDTPIFKKDDVRFLPSMWI